MLDVEKFVTSFTEDLEERLTSQGVEPLTAIRIAEEVAILLAEQLEEEFQVNDID